MVPDKGSLNGWECVCTSDRFSDFTESYCQHASIQHAVCNNFQSISIASAATHLCC